MKKILFVTGTRADYGLLRKLILLFQNSNEFETHTAVTGAHLSEHHGKTINVIENDGIKNIHEIDMGLRGDRPLDLGLAISKEMIGFSELLNELKFDLMVVLGDRYELWSPCIVATLYNVPIAHLHGGESTEGVIDESVRHSVTKMSHLHFCSHERYRQRIVNMGEQPSRVFNVGAIGLDRIKEFSFLSKEDLQNKIQVNFSTKNILCTFHPVTLNEEQSKIEITSLISALEELIISDDISIFITLPNADTYSEFIRKEWEKFILKFPDKVQGFVHLGDLNYLSLMNCVDVVLGNSSSGILEAPFLKKAVVNVGCRQEGRLASGHIMQVKGSKEEILLALKKALSKNFQEYCQTTESIYGDGSTSEKIFENILKIDFSKLLFKKFYEII